jgi:hypothetical protein
MKRAAIGVRMHSGWGALVAVSEQDGAVEIVERRRMDVIAPGDGRAFQPYHTARVLGLAKAQNFIDDSFAAANRLALATLRSVVDELRDRQYRVVGSAILTASGRQLPSLPQILAAHPLIHTAEGEFFREVFCKACEEIAVPATKIRERDLGQSAHAAFGKATTRIQKQIAAYGHAIGPPWTTDQKAAALAGLIVLANQK